VLRFSILKYLVEFRVRRREIKWNVLIGFTQLNEK